MSDDRYSSTFVTGDGPRRNPVTIGNGRASRPWSTLPPSLGPTFDASGEVTRLVVPGLATADLDTPGHCVCLVQVALDAMASATADHVGDRVGGGVLFQDIPD